MVLFEGLNFCGTLHTDEADYEGKVKGDQPRAFAFTFVPTTIRMRSTSWIRQANTVAAYRMTCFHY